MEITRHPAGQTLVLQLKGRLDGTWSERTTLALLASLEEGWHHLRLDLSGVDYVSSAGLRVLIQHYKKLAALNGSLAVINPSQPVHDLLAMAGLQSLLTDASLPDSAGPAARTFSDGPHCGLIESHPLTPGGTLHAALADAHAPHCFTADTIGLGLGSLGSEPGCPGEFLALCGAAIAQPADGHQSPDYIVEQGELRPRVLARSGIIARGNFSHCLRFESTTPHHGLPLSTLLDLALTETDADAIGLAFVAETDYLAGAALLQSGDPHVLTPLPFPEVRDQMVFTAEPAWPRSLAIGVAFATRSADSPLAPQLRPLHALRVHAHAAAFPYSSLPKGALAPADLIPRLLDTNTPLGLLHLLNDHRPSGLGESRFLRGAFWVAPLTFAPSSHA